MSELADELARRMEPEHLKAIAAEKVSDLKEQARERAVEKVDEIKTQARETVMRKSHEVKERADTPRGWSMLGAILGAGVGSMLMKKAFDVRQHSSGSSRMYGDYDRELPSLVPSPDGGLMRPTGDKLGSPGSDNLKERASEAMDMAKDKASDLKERASGLVDRARDKTHGLRERIPDRGEIRHQASDWYGTVSENPVLLAIGGLAIGALFASFIPVTNRERQLIEPAKAKVKERISTLGDQLESKLSGQDADEGGRDEEFQASASSESERERGAIPPLPPLDDFTSVH
ncbi:hypothetical protein [Archangium violaceum]|uniref:DUF3618 domain-containing protein n=1 Tax=Archangium violaceum Cb vi76 TaxID=1406225 RepID=A0A084SW78_9BACT|nr:hypothetical protein [Archangium violaceum]KFA92713.1 hypothetical protein Q664_14045 [Archangium violaceum Cb vi76]